MTTDEEIKALVKRLIGVGGDLDLLAAGALQALAARAVAAEKRLAEVEERLIAAVQHKFRADRLESALREITVIINSATGARLPIVAQILDTPHVALATEGSDANK